MDLACEIARAGLRVVIVHSVDDAGACTCGRKECPEKTRGKHPVAREWPKLATDDEQNLRDQFARLKFTPNLGIALGEQEDGYLVCIDDDDSARLLELEATYGALPHTMSGQSPRGARMFFWLPTDTPFDRLKNITGVGGKPGVDVKVAGGQVVVAGRNAGGAYSGLDVSVTIAELPPAWVLAILTPIKLPRTAATYTPQMLRDDTKVKRRHEAYLDRAVVSECRILARTGEGQRNTATYTAACRLMPLASGLHLAAGVSHVRDEVTRAAVAAGLSEGEARTTVASAEKWVVDNGLVRVPREVPQDARERARDSERAPRPRLVEDDGAPDDGFGGGVALIEDNGSPAKIAENVARLLAVHPRGAPRMNLLAHRVEWPPRPGCSSGERITDSDEIKIQGWLVAQPSATRVRVGVEAVHAGIITAAEERPFHPVREYLAGLTWDGTPRVETFAIDCLGAADSPLVRAYLRCFFVGAVARAMVPGCQLDTALVLEGPQGARKTSALRAMFGAQWFGNTLINLKKTPDCYQAIEGFWGYELAELDGHSRDAALFKAFVSQREDTYRPSYGRNTVVRVRQVAFCATTNAETYLGDETGARRWQCVKCTAVDLERVARDRDQLWAEAAHLYASGAAWWLSRDLEAVAAADVDSRYQGDAWEDQLPYLLKEHHSITSSAALLLLGVEVGRQARSDSMRVGAALRRMGWARRRVMTIGARGYEYVKCPTEVGQSA